MIKNKSSNLFISLIMVAFVLIDIPVFWLLSQQRELNNSKNASYQQSEVYSIRDDGLVVQTPLLPSEEQQECDKKLESNCVANTNDYKTQALGSEAQDQVANKVSKTPKKSKRVSSSQSAEIKQLKKTLKSQAHSYALAQCSALPSNTKSHEVCMQEVANKRYSELLALNGLK